MTPRHFQYVQGFDHFFRHLNQYHAHKHFPVFLWRNRERVPLGNEGVAVGTLGSGYATTRIRFGGDTLAAEALAFIERHRTNSFSSASHPSSHTRIEALLTSALRENESWPLVNATNR